MSARVFKLASVPLQYPTAALFDGVDDLDAHAAGTGPRAARESFARFLAWLRATPPLDVAQHYVQTFDLRRRCALYLTYYRHGDTRARGMALLALKHVYRRAGHEPPESELPDFLPLVLEFASLAPESGRRVLLQCRPGLELLRQALRDRDDPYTPVLDAVCGHLPQPRGRDRDVLRRLAAEGPPREQVGLEPFAPPEYMSATPTNGDSAR